MKRSLLICLAFAALGASAADWEMPVTKTIGGTHRMQSFSPDRFTVWGKRGQAHLKFAQTDIMKKIDKDFWTQAVFMFSCRSVSGRLIRVTPILELAGNPSNRVLRAEKIIWRGNQWRNFSFTLNEIFPLGDCRIHIARMGLAVDVENWNPGEEGFIEVKNARICKAGEVRFSGNVAEDKVTVVPSHPIHALPFSGKALRVYFAFDNEDVMDSRLDHFHSWDAQQDAGFRERLIEDLDGAIRLVNEVESADLIVYSRARPDPFLAAKIADAVTRRGVPLYAASEVADDAVRAILPCTLSTNEVNRFPTRAALIGDEKGLTTAKFGIYRTCALKPGAKAILSFANGTPATVEGVAGKGRVLYTMTAIGQTVVQGKKAYDAYFVRNCARLTDHELPEAEAVDARDAGDGWQKGVGTADFGRFGWEIGSGLLVENLGNTFRIGKGDVEYAFTRYVEKSVTERKVEFASRDVSSLSFGGTLTVDGTSFASFDASLAYPGIRWNLIEGKVNFEISGDLATVAVVTKSGVKVIDTKKQPIPPPLEWTEPWMLVYKLGAEEQPMLVTFGRKLASVEPILEEGAHAGYLLTRGAGSAGVGEVVVAWPFGDAKVNTEAWTTGLPETMLARVRFWAPRAFMYPYALAEKFRIDEKSGRVEIVDTYSYRRTEDDWQTPRRPFAPVPPLALLMQDMFASDEPLVRRMATRWGDYADKDGSTSVTWSLPLPKPDLSLLPHTLGFDKYDALANEQFSWGVKYIAGGRQSIDGRNKAYPDTPANPCRNNLSMHGFLHGMARFLPNPYIYSAKNRMPMERRIVQKLMEPLEVVPYKIVTRWRREPFTDVPYTIFFNSPRTIVTRYSDATFGSGALYGDSNESVRVLMAALQMIADRAGQTEAVRANWETVKRFVPSYLFALDDWLIMCAGCICDGSSYSIDMLNTEYGGMCTLARLAEIAGDRSMRDQALYRAARRAVPSIARFRIKDYAAAKGILPNADRVAYACGFSERGPAYVGFPAEGQPPSVCEIEIYDMSQGICQDLISLHDRYAREILKQNYILAKVDRARPETGFNYPMLAILAIGGDFAPDYLREKLDMVASYKRLNEWLKSDWPGMDTGSYLEFVYAKICGTPRITDCRDVTLYSATYDPTTKTVTLDFTPGANAALEVAGRAVDVKGAGRRVVTIAR